MLPQRDRSLNDLRGQCYPPLPWTSFATRATPKHYRVDLNLAALPYPATAGLSPPGQSVTRLPFRPPPWLGHLGRSTASKDGAQHGPAASTQRGILLRWAPMTSLSALSGAGTPLTASPLQGEAAAASLNRTLLSSADLVFARPVCQYPITPWVPMQRSASL